MMPFSDARRHGSAPAGERGREQGDSGPVRVPGQHHAAQAQRGAQPQRHRRGRRRRVRAGPPPVRRRPLGEPGAAARSSRALHRPLLCRVGLPTIVTNRRKTREDVTELVGKHAHGCCRLACQRVQVIRSRAVGALQVRSPAADKPQSCPSCLCDRWRNLSLAVHGARGRSRGRRRRHATRRRGRAPGGAAPEPGPVERDDAAGRARGQRAHDQAPGERAAAKAVDEHHRAVARRAGAALPAPPPRQALRRRWRAADGRVTQARQGGHAGRHAPRTHAPAAPAAGGGRAARSRARARGGRAAAPRRAPAAAPPCSAPPGRPASETSSPRPPARRPAGPPPRPPRPPPPSRPGCPRRRRRRRPGTPASAAAPRAAPRAARAGSWRGRRRARRARVCPRLCRARRPAACPAAARPPRRAPRGTCARGRAGGRLASPPAALRGACCSTGAGCRRTLSVCKPQTRPHGCLWERQQAAPESADAHSAPPCTQ